VRLFIILPPLSITHRFSPHSQLVTQREMVSKLVRDNLERRASRFNLILDDVSITHVTFSPAFSEAVEAKQIAQQTAQRAAYLVESALQEKQSIIVKAQGEARSAELIGEAVKQNRGCVLTFFLLSLPLPFFPFLPFSAPLPSFTLLPLPDNTSSIPSRFPTPSRRSHFHFSSPSPLSPPPYRQPFLPLYATLTYLSPVHSFLDLRKMEAAREIAGLVANSNNKLMLDSDALLLNRAFPLPLSPSPALSLSEAVD
jgi:hypothetical protein